MTTLKQKWKKLTKPYVFDVKEYSPRQKPVTFKTLAHSRSIKDVLNQIHKLDLQVNYFLDTKISKGRITKID